MKKITATESIFHKKNNAGGGANLRALSTLGVFGAFAIVGFLAMYFYSPVIKTHADSDEDSDTTHVSVQVNPVVSITVPSTLDIDITPNAAGYFGENDMDVIVNTNSNAGYTLYMSSEDESTDMTHTTASTKITSNFSGTVTSDTMEKNTWGYSLDDSAFSKIPVLSNPATIREVNEAVSSSNNTTTVYFGAKAANNLEFGTYSKVVLFTATAHPSTQTIFDITTMQEMTSAVCDATTTPLATATEIITSNSSDTSKVPRTVLTDTRDNKRYLVSKLADGNCWMSQNLALDLSTGTTLTNTKTDLNTKTSFTPENTTQTTTGTTWTQTGTEGARSYHPQSSESYYQGGTTKSSAPSGSGDLNLWESAGNYYNWYAATAGSGTSSLVGSTVNDSICPKGWKLPANTGSDSYSNLITTKYNVPSSAAGSTTLRAAPLNFVLSGYYSYYGGAMSTQGSYGYFWSSSAYSSATVAYRLLFGSSAIYPQSYDHKGYGFSVRCVAR